MNQLSGDRSRVCHQRQAVADERAAQFGFGNQSINAKFHAVDLK